MFNDTSVGVYIDEKNIYVAELKALFGNIKVSRSATLDINLPPSNPSPGIDSISPSITNALAQAGIRSKNIFTALADNDTIVRYFETPLLPKKERKSAAYFESQKFIPFNAQDFYCDCGISVNTPQKKMNVILLAAKKKRVDDFMALMQDAGLKIKGLQSASLALVRSFDPHGHKEKKGDVTLFIDVSKRFIRMLFVKDHFLLMTHYRDIPDLNFSSCVSEIRMLLNYFSKNFRNEKISNIMLCGDMKGDLNGLDRQLAEELGLKFDVFEPSKYYDNIKTYSSGILVAIGLALNGTSHDQDLRLNLVPKQNVSLSAEAKAVDKAESRELLQKVVLAEMVVLLLVLGSIHYYLSSQLKAAGIFHASPNVSSQMTLTLVELQKRSDEFKKQLLFTSKIMGKRISLTGKMNEVAKLVPADVRLTAMNYVDKEDKDGVSSLALHIEGIVLTNGTGMEWDVVNQLALALNKDKEFMRGLDDVKIISVQDSAQNNAHKTKFAIDCVTAKKALL